MFPLCPLCPLWFNNLCVTADQLPYTMTWRRMALALVFVTACGPFHQNPNDVPALIVFTNDALDEATVYIVGPASDFRRIGVVSAGRTETLKVTSDLIRGNVNIVARMLARYE